MTTIRAVALAAIGVLALAACASDPKTSPSPAFWPTASGERLEVDSLDTIDDAEVVEFDGVSFLLPAGWGKEWHEAAEPAQAIVRHPDGRNMVAVVATGELGDADAVEASSTLLLNSALRRGGTDLVRRPVLWSQWPYATAVTGGADAGETDFLAVTVLSRTDQIITVVARAPAGTMEESVAYQVLRSVKDIG